MFAEVAQDLRQDNALFDGARQLQELAFAGRIEPGCEEREGGQAVGPSVLLVADDPGQLPA